MLKKINYQITEKAVDQTNVLNSQAGEAAIDNNMWNIWQLSSNETIDDMPLWTNTMQQHVEIMTAAIKKYKTLAIFSTGETIG